MSLYDHISSLASRVRGAILRGVISALQDGPACQVAQIAGLSDELRDGVERFQEYGMSSVPPIDTEVVVVHIGGDRDHPVVIATESRRYRSVAHESGDVCLYDTTGSTVWLRPARNGIYVSSSGDVRLNDPTDVAQPAARVNDAIQVDQAALIAWINTLTAAITAWVPMPGDGGTALKVALAGWIATGPPASPYTGSITAGSGNVFIGG